MISLSGTLCRQNSGGERKDISMSTKEMCIKLLESLPESKLGYVLSYMQGLTACG